MFVMNFVHLPPAALQVLAVMYLATHCCAMWLVCSRGQCKFPGSVDGIIHMSAKRLSNIRVSLLFTKDKLTTSKLNLLVLSVNHHNAFEELKDFMRGILGRESSLSCSDSFSSPGLCLKEEKEKRRPPDIASVRAQNGSQ